MSDPIEEMAIWYKAVNFERIKSILSEALPTDSHRFVYQQTEENRSTRDIEKLTLERGAKVHFTTIASWQEAWVQQGLVKQVSAHKRERLFDLIHFGLEPATGKRKAEANSNSGATGGE